MELFVVKNSANQQVGPGYPSKKAAKDARDGLNKPSNNAEGTAAPQYRVSKGKDHFLFNKPRAKAAETSKSAASFTSKEMS